MTREEIMAGYTIAKGVIQDPGKFEGEPAYAPYFYDIVQGGGSTEILDWPDGDSTDLIEVDSDDRAMWPEIEADVVAVEVVQTDTGFVYLSVLTEREKDALLDEYNSEWADPESDVSAS